MENSETEICSDFNDKLLSSFTSVEAVLKSSTVSAEEKCAAWRQQSLIIQSFDQILRDDLMQRHYLYHPSIDDNSEEFYKYIDDALGSNLCENGIEFPNIDDIHFLRDKGDNEMMETCSIGKIPQQSSVNTSCEARNKSIDFPWKPRNTMESFLKGDTPAKNQPLFSSARELLTAQTLKKPLQSDIINQHRDNLKIPEVGFNFSATKKSLGSIGRLVTSNRKNCVSPLRNQSLTRVTDSKCVENANSETISILCHPALKNVDPKMVELINNEIIYKYKPVDWKEIAGLDYAKSIIKEAVVYPLLRPDIFTGLRRPPRGILLFGPPGTGKTLIGKCIASQSSSTFFSISSASLTSKWMGDGEKMVRALFAVAVARQPSVIFIDEIDSLLSQRSENENEGSRRLKTEFLVRLDGAATSEDDRVLIVGATNRPQELDEAVRRRFVKRLYVPLPDIGARAEILSNLLKKVENNLTTSDIQKISQLADGYSGADMDSLCREASMEPLRSLPADAIITFRKENLRHVNINDFHTALKKIRPSVSPSDLTQYMKWNITYGSNF